MKKTRRMTHFANCPYLSGSKFCTCEDEVREVDEDYVERMASRVEYSNGRVEFHGWIKRKGKWQRSDRPPCRR